jgi:FkbM family methyltransferase
MLLHTNDRGFAGNVMMDGFWEIWLTQFFARTLKPGMRVIDVGANYGYYTMLFADIVTPAGGVLAVEPNPSAVPLLRQSVSLNGFAAHTQIVEAALGAEPEGTAQLIVPDGEPKNAHLPEAGEYVGNALTVRLTSLDHLASDFGPIDMIKIDAEGSEIDIIAGMQGLLRSAPPALMLEFNTKRYRESAGFLNTLLDVYGNVAAIDFDGQAKPVTADTVLTTRRNEDWLLYFSPAQG